jgi:hypothetical protein
LLNVFLIITCVWLKLTIRVRSYCFVKFIKNVYYFFILCSYSNILKNGSCLSRSVLIPPLCEELGRGCEGKELGTPLTLFQIFKFLIIWFKGFGRLFLIFIFASWILQWFWIITRCHDNFTISDAYFIFLISITICWIIFILIVINKEGSIPIFI